MRSVSFAQLAVDRAEVAVFQLGAHGDNGLLVFTPQLVGTANRLDRRQLAKRDEANPGGRCKARAALRGGGRGQTDRQEGQMVAVIPDPIRVANANLGHAVLLRDRAGHLAVECRVQLRLDVHIGQADAGGLDAVGPDDDVGIAEIDVRVHVGRAVYLLDHLPNLLGQGAEGREVGAENLDLDGAIDSRQVVDLVLHQRHEFGLQFGDLGLDLLAEHVEQFTRRAPLARGLEADQDVPGVRLGGEETELGARPADVARDIGRAQEHVLDPAHHLVGMGQRGADRHVVVEDERAFVHVGHEAGLKRVDLDGVFSNRDRQSVNQDPPRHDRQQRQQHDRPREPEADLRARS